MKRKEEGYFKGKEMLVKSIKFSILIYMYVQYTGWFFLTGPPLKMCLDWPPQKMPRLPPPCFGKVLSMAAEKGEIPNTLTFSIPRGASLGL